MATSVGQRCPDCARARPLPTYDVGAPLITRALVAGFAAALVLGAAWGYFNRAGLRRNASYDWSFWFALLAGFVIAEVVSWSARRKRGSLLGWVAIGSVLVAFVVSRLVVSARAVPVSTGGGLVGRASDLGSLLQLDFTHLLFVAMACGIAYIRFR